jgi:hypothetical protein
MSGPSDRTPMPAAGPASGDLTPLAITRFTPRESQPATVPASRDPVDYDRRQTGRYLAAFDGRMDADCEQMVQMRASGSPATAANTPRVGSFPAAIDPTVSGRFGSPLMRARPAIRRTRTLVLP